MKIECGIACDLCHQTHQKTFTYYSIDFQELSLDCCKKCMHGQLKDKIVSNAKYLRNAIACDFCGQVIQEPLKGKVTELHVSFTNMFECIKCKTNYIDPTEACKSCQGLEYQRKVDIVKDQNFLELNLCEKDLEWLRQFKHGENQAIT